MKHRKHHTERFGHVDVAPLFPKGEDSNVGRYSKHVKSSSCASRPSSRGVRMETCCPERRPHQDSSLEPVSIGMHRKAATAPDSRYVSGKGDQNRHVMLCGTNALHAMGNVNNLN